MACEAAPQLAKRVVFLSDQQWENWLGADSPDQVEKIPPMQVVDLSPPEDVENTWISDFHVQGGVADVETPALFVVELRHRGPTERKDLQVSLWVDGAHSETKTVTLPAGEGSREVTFEHIFTREDAYRHRFDNDLAMSDPDDEEAESQFRPVFMPVNVTIPKRPASTRRSTGTWWCLW